MQEKLHQYFGEMIVYKDLKKSNFFSSMSLPSFLRDWILKEFQTEDGSIDLDQATEFIHSYIPKKDQWISIKNNLIIENQPVKILAKISADVDIKSSIASFSLPEFGLTNKETVIEPAVWNECKDKLTGGERWGIIELGYKNPSGTKNQGRIKLLSFEDFCPYEIDLDYYKDACSKFTLNERIDMILGAIDYNADGYDNQQEKLTVMSRLLPFVEKRLNLIELAPKGTGKSYLLGRVSRYGWLSSGGVMSRAKMFYDINRRVPGLVCNNDYVALDEVQTISFTDVDEMRAALKGYMESGVFTVGNYEGVADSGIILLGNIKQESMNEYNNMFEDLPSVFHESALIDRFHGFIRGWRIPRMNDDLKSSGWAINSEYFSSIMHLLRDDPSYRAIVDQLIIVPEKADTRDTEAVKRICTAYLKLLFPNVRSASDIDPFDFRNYCLDPAVEMRDIIKLQLGKLDVEYADKPVPRFEING